MWHLKFVTPTRPESCLSVLLYFSNKLHIPQEAIINLPYLCFKNNESHIIKSTKIPKPGVIKYREISTTKKKRKHTTVLDFFIGKLLPHPPPIFLARDHVKHTTT